MPQRRSRPTAGLAAAAALGLAAPLPAGGQEPIPVGGELQVNTHTTTVGAASVAVAGDGDFVVVWQSQGSLETDTSSWSVQGRRYASNGLPQGGQFQVNTQTSSAQIRPHVASAADGDFVVVWGSYASGGTDTSQGSIQVQRYASDGSKQGGELQVNTYTTGRQRAPRVAVKDGGDFAVVWASDGSYESDTSESSVQGRRFASDGSPQGPQFQVNTYTTSYQDVPSVAAAADGDFVVVWQSGGSFGTDTDVWSLQGQRYSSDGSPQGGEFQVNAYTTHVQFSPSIATATADGGFVVTWESYGSFGSDTSTLSIQARRFASDGTALGGEFQVNSYTPFYQYAPSVAAEDDGEFVVVWHSYSPEPSYSSAWDVRGQRFASDGSPLGAEFQVNTYTTLFQEYPSVAARPDGGFVVAWVDGAWFPPNPAPNIKAQRFAAPSAVPSVSPAAAAAGALLLLLAVAFALRRRA
jgi:hypothetical protein